MLKCKKNIYFTTPPVGIAKQFQGVLQEQHDLQMQILVCYIFFLNTLSPSLGKCLERKSLLQLVAVKKQHQDLCFLQVHKIFPKAFGFKQEHLFILTPNC